MKMRIIEYYASDNKEHWLNEIKRSDWDAGQFLFELLHDNRLKELCGESTKVLLLTDGDVLVSFCTYAEKDDVRDTDLTPWVGFVYTFPKYRGKRHMGKLLDRAYDLAKNDRHKHIYISTGETGLYEKYGYSFWKMMKDMHGNESRVYRINVAASSHVEVRHAKREELEEVNRLRKMVNELHVKGRPGWFRPGFGDELKNYIYEFYDGDNNDVIVTVTGGVIRGFASVQLMEYAGSPYSMPRKFYHIMEFGVDEACRRKGVATALIEYCKKDALNKGVHRIELDYWSFNEDAEKFYEATGFKVFRKYTELYV